jgi:hypothetical protein
MPKRKYFQKMNDNIIYSQVIRRNGIKALLPKSWGYQKVSVKYLNDNYEQSELYVLNNGNNAYVTCPRFYLGTYALISKII